MSSAMAYGSRSLPLKTLQQEMYKWLDMTPWSSSPQEQNLLLSSTILGVDEYVSFEDGWV